MNPDGHPDDPLILYINIQLFIFLGIVYFRNRVIRVKIGLTAAQYLRNPVS
jgi:hypothetical protein